MKKFILATILLALVTASVIAQTASNLKNQTRNEIGYTMSSYSYSEPSLGVSTKATNVGIDYTGTYAFSNDLLILCNINYNYFSAKYSGSGTQSGIPQNYYDINQLLDMYLLQRISK